jgi:hypothetical protein
MSRYRTFCNAALAGLIALTALPLLTLNSNSVAQGNEKRNLATWPHAPQRWSQIGRYLQGLQTYFADHFGFRQNLIDARNAIEFDLFGNSPEPTVVIGRNDWLFYTGNRSVEDYRGRRRFSDEELRTWSHALQRRRDWLAERGTAYAFVVAPNKQSIYPENMPPGIARGKDTMLAQLQQQLRTQGLNDVLIDPAAALIAQKGGLNLYHPLDTHWNALGAYIGYRAVLDKLSTDSRIKGSFPVSVQREDFASATLHTGDLASMMGVPNYPRETLSAAFVGPQLPCGEQIPPPNQASAPRADFATDCALEGRKIRVLIFRDSMSNALERYFAASFRHVRFVWTQPGFADFQRYVEAEQPDLVIEERAERFLNNPPSP